MPRFATKTSAVVAALLCATTANGADEVTLVTFDGAAGTTLKWYPENDPVMGGLSKSTFKVQDNVGVFDGQVKIVPSLQAPGFCYLRSEGAAKVNSAKGQTHMALTLRNAGIQPDYVNYKVSFAADTLNPQFKSFKADFNVSADATNWTTVHIPFTQFTNDWSPATGEPKTTCAENKSVCVTQDDLAKIYQFGVWAEGKAGAFHLEMQSISAVTLKDGSDEPRAAAAEITSPKVVVSNTAAGWNNTCKAETQATRWNVSVAGQFVQLPFVPPSGLPKAESFADAICCDAFFRPFAEPSGFFQQPDVALFDKLNASGETTFYDSVCGEPLFVAPRNRTFAEWKAESNEHGWPSFRDAEIVKGAITIEENTGFVFSKCGTHLGSYLPDSEGDRYCLDLACLSGEPK